MQLFKRTISLILAFVLLLGNVPAVYAAEGETIPETEAVEAEAVETTAEVIPEEAEAPTEAPETEPPVEETTVVTEETVPVTGPAEETTSTETVPEETEEMTIPVETAEVTVPEETVPEETVPEETKDEFVLPGLPEGYETGEMDAYHRQSILESDILAELKDQIPGVDYVADEIIVFARNEEEATLFAAAFGGELRSFSGKMAVIGLTEISVYEAMEASVSGEFLLPAASPNHIAEETVVLEVLSANANATFASVGDAAPVEKDWNYWVNVVGIDDPDLQDPGSADYEWWHDMLDTYAAWGVTMGSKKMDIAYIAQRKAVNNVSNWPDTEKKYTVMPASGQNSGNSGSSSGDINRDIVRMVGIVNNGKQGAGIAPNTRVNVYYPFNASGKLTVAGMVECILDAADYSRNRVIAIYDYFYSYNAALEAAVNYALEKGKPVIARATNIHGLSYPAAFDGVICPAFVNSAGRRNLNSPIGPVVDFAVPAANDYSALSVTAGAVMLYISANPDTTPAQLEQAMKKACTKCVDANVGAGILNLAKLFGGKAEAPKFEMFDYCTGSYIQPGKGTTNVPCESDITFLVPEASRDDGGMLLISDNGKAPAVKEGVIVNGFTTEHFYEEEGLVNYYVDLSDYAGKTVTFQAAWVSGMGVMGNVTTAKLKVAPSSNIARIDLSGPGVSQSGGMYEAIALSGKSYTYTATLIPKKYQKPNGEYITADVTDQRVTWEIDWNYSKAITGARIDKNGKLTLPKGKTGKLLLRVTSVADPAAKDSILVNVKSQSPISKITLKETAITINKGSTGYVTIDKLLQADGTDRTTLFLETFGVKWTSSNEKVVQVTNSTNLRKGYITAVGAGTANVTATILDGSNKRITCKVTVKQPVEELQQDTELCYILPGKSVSIKPTVLPKNASNKTLSWKLIDSDHAGITVNEKNGKVTVAKDVPAGSRAEVQVTANDGSGVKATYYVLVYPKCDSMYVGMFLFSGEKADDYDAKFDKNNNLTSLTLYTATPVSSSARMTAVNLNARGYFKIGNQTATESCTFTSSNSAVASVTSSGKVTAHKAGTAKITVTSADGTKKHTITVNVVTPPSAVTLSTTVYSTQSGGTKFAFLAAGCSAQTSYLLADAYGKPSAKSVTWECNVQIRTFSYTTDAQKEKANSYIDEIEKQFAFRNGKLSIKKGFPEYDKLITDLDCYLYLSVKAIVDGVESEELWYYSTKAGITSLIPEHKTYTIHTADYDNNNPQTVKVWFQQAMVEDSFYSSVTCTSSNPSVAGVASVNFGRNYDSDRELYFGNFNIFIPEPVTKPTTVTLTFKANDGTNKSTKVTLKLMPELEIKHALPEYDSGHILAAGYSTTLKAVFGSTAAKVDWSVKLTYDVGEPVAKPYLDQVKDQLENGIRIDSKGKLSVDKSLAAVLYDMQIVKRLPLTIGAEVTATAKEGGGSKTATYDIVSPETYVKPSVSSLIIDTSNYVGTSYSGLEVLSNTAPWLQVTVSNPKLVSVTPDNVVVMTSDKVIHKDYFVHILEEVTKPTNVTVTFKTVDGTNKSFKVTLKLVP